MTRSSEIIQLPESRLGAERCLEMSMNFHYDLQIAISQGSAPSQAPLHEVVRFNFAHGNELKLVASLVGYYARLDVTAEETKHDFLAAASPLLLEDHRPDYGGFRSSEISMAADGANLPFYDLPTQDLRCLAMPMTSRPGPIENIGGTGIYTKQPAEGELLLVLASLRPAKHTPASEELILASAELCRQDVLPVASLICRLSMGEYRRDIFNFVMERFQQPAEA